MTSRFIYGTKVNVPEYMLKGGVTYRLITDQLGSVRLVVNASTGAVAQRIDYDEFGVVTSDTNPGFQPFGFAGGLYDSDTKLVRFGARDYDAETGRWTTQDSIQMSLKENSKYLFELADPINRLDPIGQSSDLCAGPVLPKAKKIDESRSCEKWEVERNPMGTPLDQNELNTICNHYVAKEQRNNRVLVDARQPGGGMNPIYCTLCDSEPVAIGR